MYDGKNFDKLIEHITGFVDDLEKLVPVEDVCRRLGEMEIEEVDDEPSLIALQDAAADTDNVLAEFATKRLERLRGEGNSAKSIQSDESARVRVGNEWTEAALSHNSGLSGQTWNEADSIATKGASAVHVGNSYGGRGIFDS